MPIKIRPNPVIPDHEVLRKIGGGAYGEVWLARGVTGALRAIKVVWREDFEDERGFEREFEGILKFEPMSRDHPALVNILHVGRSPDSLFYYYVMELGDDVTTGQDINPVEYEPRTLRADTQHTVGVQWDTNVCIDVGLRLAEALDHLHERGLAHRDVKPSNVIFVNGRAKLADIGLVAARGQRTFVGTEGFVPPEGPGSSQADVYSLGKVLYELATGKDRLAFPELPDQIPTGLDRKRWLELNKIICDICEPRISKRKISTAAELAEALRCLQRGKRRRRSGVAVWMTTLVLTGFIGWAGWELGKDSAWVKRLSVRQKTVEIPTVRVLVNSGPEGAEVYDSQGAFLGMSNSYSKNLKVGDHYHFIVKKSGYKPAEFNGYVKKAPPGELQEPQEVLWKTLEVFSPPLTGEKWIDHLGQSYLPQGDFHVGAGFIGKPEWDRFAREKKIPDDRAEFLDFSENGKPVKIAVVSENDAQEFGRWYYGGAYQDGNGGFLTNEHEVKVLFEKSFENAGLSERAKKDGLKPFRICVRPIDFGQIILTTNTPRVDVFMSPAASPNEQVSAGYTSGSQLLIPKVKPGKWNLTLIAEGFKTRAMKDVVLKDGEKLALQVDLERNLGIVFGKTWTNGIDMRFEPVEEDLMASAWETRVKDFKKFVSETGYSKVRVPDFPQTDDHPVVNVSREDAQEFCKWLTERERKEDRIAKTHEYRLPTDLEWSNMVGLQEETGISPGWRDARKEQMFPWGRSWPGSAPVGNFADISAAASPGVSIDRTMPAYNDGFAQTAPVGSFPPNPHKLYDMSGNAQEWVADDYSNLGNSPLGVLRGGGWTTYQAESLYSGSRNAVPPDFRDVIYGFRVVLAKVPPKGD